MRVADLMQADLKTADADTTIADAVVTLADAQVSAIMPDAEVREAAQQMLYLEIHRLLVEDRGKLVGVISQTDVVREVALATI